jgi:23S rRNA (cytidine1920-2'-O)/16S rRNA (cytidine1409-2'-O)-methyltransferase
MGEKKRLDSLLVEKRLVKSRQRAQAVILAGKVLVDGQPMDKAGHLVTRHQKIELKGSDIPYVSRGGLKLEKAIQTFGLDVNGFQCLDVGASTGGFTDCLLQHGAQRIYAVDVGYGQLAWSLRQNPRVIVMERTNIRHMPPDTIPPVNLVTIDTSFISLKIVVPAALPFLKPQGHLLALVKPQFEVGKGQVGKRGVVRDPVRHRMVLDKLTGIFRKLGLICDPPIPSPILGPRGNREFFMHLRNP